MPHRIRRSFPCPAATSRRAQRYQKGYDFSTLDADQKGTSVEDVRRIRDDIRSHVEELINREGWNG